MGLMEATAPAKMRFEPPPVRNVELCLSTDGELNDELFQLRFAPVKLHAVEMRVLALRQHLLLRIFLNLEQLLAILLRQHQPILASDSTRPYSNRSRPAAAHPPRNRNALIEPLAGIHHRCARWSQ